MKIVCFGEALIDFKETAALAFQGFVGGSPLNVAVAAARLGTPVALASQISADFLGEAIMLHMARNGVSGALILRHDAPSTVAFVAEHGGDVDFTFLNEHAADTLYDPQPRPVLPESVRFISFGSISLLRDPAGCAILETVAAHRERCALVFDPNVRPALIPDKTAFFSLLERALGLAHIAKVSTQDLRWLYPDTPPLEAAQGWLGHGPEAIIVTQGSSGTALLRREGRLEVPTPVVRVEDTVGAGDTFMGALLVRLEEQGHTRGFHALPDTAWRDALSFAAAAAALNCTRPGADPPTRAELEAMHVQGID